MRKERKELRLMCYEFKVKRDGSMQSRETWVWT
jgi:hypothetical protein